MAKINTIRVVQGEPFTIPPCGEVLKNAIYTRLEDIREYNDDGSVLGVFKKLVYYVPILEEVKE